MEFLKEIGSEIVMIIISVGIGGIIATWRVNRRKANELEIWKQSSEAITPEINNIKELINGIKTEFRDDTRELKNDLLEYQREQSERHHKRINDLQTYIAREDTEMMNKMEEFTLTVKELEVRITKVETKIELMPGP